MLPFLLTDWSTKISTGDGVEICEPAEEPDMIEAMEATTEAAEADCRVLGCGTGAECQYQPSDDRFRCRCSRGYKVCHDTGL